MTDTYELPPLPGDIQSAKDLLRVFSPERVEAMMREYARAAILAERERIIGLFWQPCVDYSADDIAAAIRAG
jgi:hypothetical protein